MYKNVACSGIVIAEVNVGATVEPNDSCCVVGEKDCGSVGAMVGATVETVGVKVGFIEGFIVGSAVGFAIAANEDGSRVGAEVNVGAEVKVGASVGWDVKSNIGQFELRGQRLSDMPKKDKPIAHTARCSAVKSTG